MKSEQIVADHPFDFQDASSRLPLEIVAASITALRSGTTAPELIWTPMQRCSWKAQLAVWRPYDAERATGPFGDFAWSQTATEAPSAVETLLSIQHGSQSLVHLLQTVGPRTLRVMVWTNDQLPGYPRTPHQWTRITLDDAQYVLTRRHTDRWTSLLASPIVSPQVDVADIPVMN